MPKRRKKKQDWIHRLETKGVTNLPQSSLSEGQSAQEMAQAIRSSAPDFQAAMALVTLHQNTMGSRLSKTHERELERVKHILRNMYKRKDRIRDYEIPKKKGKLKWLKSRAAAYPVMWHDEQNKPGYGDMFVELLGKTPEQIAHLSGYHKRMFKHINEWTEFLKKYFKTDDIEKIKRLLYEYWRDDRHDELPVWDLTDYKPRVVKKEASVRELVFASEDEALTYLANVTGQRVLVAAKKDQEIKKRRLTVADVDPEMARRLNEIVAVYGKRQEQLAQVEAIIKQKIAKELKAQELLNDAMKVQLKELEKLMSSFKTASSEATSVLVEIGDTDVSLSAYVSIRPAYQKALDEFSKSLDEKQRQALRLIIDSSYEIKTKLELIKREREKEEASEVAEAKSAAVMITSGLGSSFITWWSSLVQRLEKVYDWVAGMMTDVSKLRGLKDAIAAGKPVEAR